MLAFAIFNLHAGARGVHFTAGKTGSGSRRQGSGAPDPWLCDQNKVFQGGHLRREREGAVRKVFPGKTVTVLHECFRIGKQFAAQFKGRGHHHSTISTAVPSFEDDA